MVPQHGLPFLARHSLAGIPMIPAIPCSQRSAQFRRSGTPLKHAERSSHSADRGRRSPETARGINPPRCQGPRQPRSPARGNSAARDRSCCWADQGTVHPAQLAVVWDWWRNWRKACLCSQAPLSVTGVQPGQRLATDPGTAVRSPSRHSGCREGRW